MSEPESARAAALQIARCPEVPRAAESRAHPCARIVAVQKGAGDQRHLPEPWAGNIEAGRILFLSTNPSLSEAGDHQSGDVVERYPLAGWSEDETADFFLRRFGTEPKSPATPDGHFRRVDGRLSPKRVSFWVGVRKRAEELLGAGASPEHDYCMTEVVHCKSKRERGVAAASALCAQLHLDRVMRVSPAPLVVVLGAKARDRVLDLWDLPPGFGSIKSMVGDPASSMAVRRLGGAQRLVVYLPHPTGMTKLRTFQQVYLDRGHDLRAVARDQIEPAALVP